MLKLYPRNAHVICCIIIGSLVQAQGFSTTVVKEGEDAIIDCGLQTKVEEGYLRWETMTNGSPVDLAYDIRDGQSNCNDRIINCTLYANGSIHLESVSKEDGARYYRCLRGDDNGYDYYSDHRLLVLSKESPSISQSPTSAIAFKASRKGIVHSYGEPVCEDDVDGNLPVVCYPPSGVIVDREYETIQCNCTDSDRRMDSVTFPVTRQMSSPPLIETPHRESVSSYNMGKKGVLHGYNAPVCEDDVDGNLPVVCYPPPGIIVDREYETIQCNCTDSDGQVDSVTFPVTSVTHWVHPDWKKATISPLVISILIILVLILICGYLYMKLKKSKAYHPAADPEEMKPIRSGTKDQQISDLEEKIATLEETYYYAATKDSPCRERIFNEKDICLVLKMKKGRIYDRWMGTITVSRDVSKCVVLTALGDGVVKNKDVHWDDFVKRTLDLPTTNHLVKIEGIGIEKSFLYLITEHLVCDPLDSIVTGDSSTQGEITSIMSVTEVMNILAGILEGMEILNSYGFLHPGLSTKKILYTKQGQCKLYDFCLAEDAPKIIAFKKTQNEVSKNLNLYPPEALFRSEYTTESDVWATAIVIWEVIADGKPPFSVDKEIKPGDNIIAPNLLWPERFLQLRNLVLFECWNENCALRPSIHALKASFKTIFEN